MRDPLLETSGRVAAFYEREFYCFSNFSSFTVRWRNRLWLTSEHAYHAAKFMDTHPEIVEEIFSAQSAYEALQIAKRNKDLVPKDWGKRKVPTMEDICQQKLLQHSYIQKKLSQTFGKIIVEDSPVDSFWGWGPDRNGRNELGKIWMRLRTKMMFGANVQHI